MLYFPIAFFVFCVKIINEYYIFNDFIKWGIAMKKVLIISTPSIASQRLIENTHKALEQKNIKVEIDCMSENKARKHLEDYDLILIDPVLRFLLNLKNFPSGNLNIAVIDSFDYGKLDGQAIAKYIMAL